MGKLKADDILDALRAELGKRGRPKGAEWMTIPEWVEALNAGQSNKISESFLRKKFAGKVQAGTAEMVQGTAPDNRGTERRVNYFKVKP